MRLKFWISLLKRESTRFHLSTWRPFSSGSLSTLILLPLTFTDANDQSSCISTVPQARRKNAKLRINFSCLSFFSPLILSFFYLFFPILYYLIIFSTSFSYPNPKKMCMELHFSLNIQSKILRFLLVIRHYGNLTGKLFVLVSLRPL